MNRAQTSSDAIPPPPAGKPGRLKITCGGCFALLVFVCAAAALLGWRLAGWDSGLSAWNRLPPSAVWAMEAHDVDGLLRHAFADKGVQAAFERLRTLLPRLREELAGGGVEARFDSFDSLRDAYRRIAPLYTAVFPNIAGMGAGGSGGNEIFAYIRPPRIFMWMTGIGNLKPGTIEYFTDGGDAFSGFHLCLLDGWLFISPTRGILEEIADAWPADRKPFGEPSGREDPHVSFGFRAEPEIRLEAPASGPLPGLAGVPSAVPGMRLLAGDPFSIAAANAAPPAAGASVHSARFVIRPSGGYVRDAGSRGWRVSGNVWLSPPPGGETTPPAREAAFLFPPGAPGERGADVRLGARVGAGERRRLLAWLDAMAGGISPVREPAWMALGWLWLRDVWLADASGDFLFAANAPRSPAWVDGTPPLPIAVLGWALNPAGDPAKAAERFASAASAWFAALAAPGGDPLLRAARDMVRHQTRDDADGIGGETEIPFVAANGMRPAWFFPKGAGVASGWAATDPAGLPGPAAALAVFGDAYYADAAGVDSLALGWNVGEEFLRAAHDAAADRLASLPAALLPDKEAAWWILDAADMFFRMYPAGVADVRLEDGGGTLAIQAGMESAP